MTQIKFTITDNDDGTARFVSDPPARKIIETLSRGDKATAAHCLAIAAMKALLAESRNHKKNSPIKIPKLELFR